MNDSVKVGDSVFTICPCPEYWEPGQKLIYKETVSRFESASHHSDRIVIADGTYRHQWFLTIDEAKQKVLERIAFERKRLDEMEASLE